MLKIIRFLLLAALFWAAQPGWATGYVVIANPSLASVRITSADLRQIFLGAKTRVGSQTVVPVLAHSGAIHQEFVAECLGKSEWALESFLRAQVFSGKGSMPKRFSGSAAIVDYVARTEGAIGYVSADAVRAGVVVVRPVR